MAESEPTALAVTERESPSEGRTAPLTKFISEWGLVICGAIGVLLLGVGAYVLLRDGGSGPLTALIATGGILVTLGVLGHRITVIRYRELEIRLLVEAAEQLRKENPAGAELLEDAAANIAAESQSPRLSRTSTVAEALAKLEANIPESFRLEDGFVIDGVRIDALLTREADGAVFWVKSIQGMPMINRARSKLAGALSATDSRPAGVIVISDTTSQRITKMLSTSLAIPVLVLKRNMPEYQFKDWVRRFVMLDEPF